MLTSYYAVKIPRRPSDVVNSFRESFAIVCTFIDIAAVSDGHESIPICCNISKMTTGVCGVRQVTCCCSIDINSCYLASSIANNYDSPGSSCNICPWSRVVISSVGLRLEDTSVNFTAPSS